MAPVTAFPHGETKFSYGATATNNSTWTGPPPGWPAIVGASPGLGAILPAASDLSASGVTLDNTVFEEWSVAGTFNMGGMDISLIALNPGWLFTAPPPCRSTAVKKCSRQK